MIGLLLPLLALLIPAAHATNYVECEAIRTVIGCIPDFPINRTWGCRQCDAAFFKNTPRNKAALGGLVPHQWPKE